MHNLVTEVLIFLTTHTLKQLNDAKLKSHRLFCLIERSNYLSRSQMRPLDI